MDDVDKPSAVATISQWCVAKRNASPDSDGRITNWKCSLAAKHVLVPVGNTKGRNAPQEQEWDPRLSR